MAAMNMNQEQFEQAIREEKRACLYSVRPFVSVIPIQA